MAKYLPHGTTFSFGGQVVGGIVTIGIPSQSRGSAETTDSESDFWREFIPGLRDPGQVSLTFRHNPADAGQAALAANFLIDSSANIVECVITLPAAAGSAGRIYTFDGFVQQPPTGDLGLAEDTAAELSATIQLAGAIAIT